MSIINCQLSIKKIMTLYPKLIMDALAKVRYPGTGKDLVTMGMVEDNIRIDGNKVSFSLLFEKPNDPFIKSVVKAAETAILTYVGEEVEIKGNITVEAKQAARPEPDKLLPEVKNIIAVSSGKGGVGKSTVAANLAVALAYKATRSVCWMPIYSGPRSLRCSVWKKPVPIWWKLATVS